MMPFLKDVYGNASSVHTFGQEAKKYLAQAEQIGQTIAKAGEKNIFMNDFHGGNWYGVK